MITDSLQRETIENLAQRHGFSTSAVEHLAMALLAGGTNQAQFNHVELGGMGQWSSGGMIMIGDMFNNGLKQRIDALCSDIAGYIRSGQLSAPRTDQPFQSQSQSDGSSLSLQSSTYSSSWPQHLGQPSSTGSQNNLRYAFFPTTRRLAIDVNGQITVYDTKNHNTGGFSQQQSSNQSQAFTSQHGLVRLSDLEIVSGDGNEAPRPKGQGASSRRDEFLDSELMPTPNDIVVASASADHDDIISKIERLAGLHSKGILSDDEFVAKKTELLPRL